MDAKLSRVAVGWYATADGTWAVIGDAPGEVATKLEADGGGWDRKPGINTGCSTQREWQIVHDPNGQLRVDSHAGQIVAWCDTLGEGRADLPQHMARASR